MQPFGRPGPSQAGAVPLDPLAELLARYPSLNAPQSQNTTNAHMNAVAQRASTVSRGQLLSDYLSRA